MLVIVAGGVTGVYYFAAIDFLGAIAPRLVTFMEYGVEASNRAYVYKYLTSQVPPMLGYGLGNANLIFSEFRGSNLVSSHISLFVNQWFSLGVIGFGLMLLFVLFPVFSRRVLKSASNTTSGAVLLASIVTWFVCFVGHSEELTVMFAVIYGLLWAHVRKMQDAKLAYEKC